MFEKYILLKYNANFNQKEKKYIVIIFSSGVVIS